MKELKYKNQDALGGEIYHKNRIRQIISKYSNQFLQISCSKYESNILDHILQQHLIRNMQIK